MLKLASRSLVEVIWAAPTLTVLDLGAELEEDMVMGRRRQRLIGTEAAARGGEGEEKVRSGGVVVVSLSPVAARVLGL